MNTERRKLQSSNSDDLQVCVDIFFCFEITHIQQIHKWWIKSKPNYIKTYTGIILHC